jgi:hypothetical protein
MTRRCVSTRPDVRLFPLFCALFFPAAFSFVISMAFPVFAASQRPVNRLYFFSKGFFTSGHENERLWASGEGQLHLRFLM